MTDRTSERGKMTDERLKEIQERLDKARNCDRCKNTHLAHFDIPDKLWESLGFGVQDYVCAECVNRVAIDRGVQLGWFVNDENYLDDPHWKPLDNEVELLRARLNQSLYDAPRDLQEMNEWYVAQNDELTAQVRTLTAENAELRREISEHVLRADSLRAEIRRLEEEMEPECYHTGNFITDSEFQDWCDDCGERFRRPLSSETPEMTESLAEVKRLTRVIAEAVRLTDEYLEDEDSLVTDDPFTEGTCQVASEIRAILKGES